jgi:hypothetical protein
MSSRRGFKGFSPYAVALRRQADDGQQQGVLLVQKGGLAAHGRKNP